MSLEVENKTPRIMVVVDSEAQEVVLCHIFEQQGWEVVAVNSTDHALQTLYSATDKKSPDLISIDYHLAIHHGGEFCRRLKLNINTQRIPILIFNGENGDGNGYYALGSGADDYLPIHADDEILVQKIKTMLEKSQEPQVLFGIGSSLFRRSRILVVDENPTYLDFLEKSFKEEDIHIDKAMGGNEALEKMKKKKYDCLLVNMDMPDINGIEICREVVEMRQSVEEPLTVLMITAHESKEDMTRALEAGADDFVGKSSDISIIKARMIALLRRKFILEDNQRIFEELKRKELEVERSRIETAAAETKALLAKKLLNTVEQLEEEIEERIRMEKEIKNYSMELERSNKELEAFAYLVSHDLQEPLRAISSYLQLLELKYKSKFDDKGKNFIGRAINAAHSLQEMINDLLMYSRITSSETSFGFYSLENILDQALTNLSVALDRKNTVVSRDPMPELYCDDSQILRLFQNLISNAVKFCDQKRAVIHISAQEQNNQWLFSVIDNGIGIDRNYKDTIFKLFQQPYGKKKYSGSGIGLSICQKIVQRHEGKIWVDSEPGKGSTFFFTLKTQMIED